MSQSTPTGGNDMLTRAYLPQHLECVLNLDNLGDPLFQSTSGRVLVQKTIDGVRKGIERFQGQPFLYAYYKKPLYRCLNEPVER